MDDLTLITTTTPVQTRWMLTALEKTVYGQNEIQGKKIHDSHYQEGADKSEIHTPSTRRKHSIYNCGQPIQMPEEVRDASLRDMNKNYSTGQKPTPRTLEAERPVRTTRQLKGVATPTWIITNLKTILWPFMLYEMQAQQSKDGRRR